VVFLRVRPAPALEFSYGDQVPAGSRA
jgi:hypothetical protein